MDNNRTEGYRKGRAVIMEVDCWLVTDRKGKCLNVGSL